MQIINRHFFNQPGEDPNYFARVYGAARRFHKHRASLDTQAELICTVAQAYWKYIQAADPLGSRDFVKRLFWQSRCRVRVAVEYDVTLGGYIVLNGELKALWSDRSGLGRKLIVDAIKQGAYKLTCFDGYLVGLYSQFGFEVVSREPNWVEGGPDCVRMELRASCRSSHCECSESDRAHCDAKLEDRQRADRV
jgi:hypothetical protein